MKKRDFHYTKPLEKKLRKLLRKNKRAYQEVISKIRQIASSPNIEHYKNLRSPLQEYKGVHVLSSFVLTFKYDRERDEVEFIKLEHHDDVYEYR